MCAELRWEIGCFRLEEAPRSSSLVRALRPDIIDVLDNQRGFLSILDDDRHPLPYSSQP